jgi:hypothetical protein
VDHKQLTCDIFDMIDNVAAEGTEGGMVRMAPPNPRWWELGKSSTPQASKQENKL